MPSSGLLQTLAEDMSLKAKLPARCVHTLRSCSTLTCTLPASEKCSGLIKRAQIIHWEHERVKMASVS